MVDHVGQVGGMGGQHPARKIKNAYQEPKAEPGADAVNLSSDVMRLRGMDGIRLDKVMEIRKQVAEGSYLTHEKLDTALDKALDEVMDTRKPE